MAAVEEDKRELNAEQVKDDGSFIKEQVEDADDLLLMLKELEPSEKREVRGILIGLQMAKMAGNRTA